MQNGYGESFNGSMRDKSLNETLFLSLDHARVEIAAWVEDYNLERPHSAIGHETPAAFAADLQKRAQRRERGHRRHRMRHGAHWATPRNVQHPKRDLLDAHRQSPLKPASRRGDRAPHGHPMAANGAASPMVPRIDGIDVAGRSIPRVLW